MFVFLGCYHMPYAPLRITSPIESTKKAYSEITSLKQSYNSNAHIWSTVSIFYRVDNIGNSHIDNYKVFFEIRMENGTKLSINRSGEFLPEKSFQEKHTIVDVVGQRIENICVKKTEVK